MSHFKTVEDAAQFIAGQKTRKYQNLVLENLRKTHGEKFESDVRAILNKRKKITTPKQFV